MTLEGARPQKEEAPTAGCGAARPGTGRLMEEVVERENLKAALRRVRQNKGSPGTDGMKTEELLPSKITANLLPANSTRRACQTPETTLVSTFLKETRLPLMVW